MGMDRESIEQYLRSVDAYPLKDFVPQRSEKLNLTLARGLHSQYTGKRALCTAG